MEIVSARSALLSNFEVYKLLKEQRDNAPEAAAPADEAYEKDEPRPVIRPQDASGIPDNLTKIRDETLTYLTMAPHPLLRQSEDGLKTLMGQLKSIELTKSEKLMIANLAPTTDVELYAIIEELEDRFPDRVEDVLGAVAGSLSEAPVMDVPMESTEDYDPGAFDTGRENGLGDSHDAEGDDEWIGEETEYYDEGPVYGMVDDLADDGGDEE